MWQRENGEWDGELQREDGGCGRERRGEDGEWDGELRREDGGCGREKSSDREKTMSDREKKKGFQREGEKVSNRRENKFWELYGGNETRESVYSEG